MEIKKLLNKVSDAISTMKRYLIKDNVGLHFCVAYIIYDVSVKWNHMIALSGVLLGIFLIEVYNRYVQKGTFSYKDIVAGLLGLVTAYFMNT